ncbi:uncharacterized protein LOC130683086 [Manis pentadactyla]|uniref:uncharacterized protein LOC130683086 n=1 Tax=Manis pentadactyla TaxID=143292 RepID=UPI00255C65BF|nr:uncharacterized protein LOC130683086 [Manis pentadactyla]
MELQAANELLALLKPKLERREKERKVSSESQEQNLRGELPGPAGLVSPRRACPPPQAPPCQKPRSPGWRKGRAADIITSAGPGIGTRHHLSAGGAVGVQPAARNGLRTPRWGASRRPGGAPRPVSYPACAPRVGPLLADVPAGRVFVPPAGAARTASAFRCPRRLRRPAGGRTGGLSSNIVASGKFIILHLHTCCPGISPQGLVICRIGRLRQACFVSYQPIPSHADRNKRGYLIQPVRLSSFFYSKSLLSWG